jgi:hypothetical protein
MRTARLTATHSAGLAKRLAITASCHRPMRKMVKPTRQTANRCQTWVSTAPQAVSAAVFWLARLAGFEPATRCLEGSCSIRLSYRRLPNVLCSIQVTQRPQRLDNGHDRDLSGVRAGSRAAVLQGQVAVEPGAVG